MVVAISDSPGSQCRWVRFGEGVVVVHNTKGWSTRVREMEGTNKTRDLHPLTRRYSIRLLPPSLPLPFPHPTNMRSSFANFSFP